MNHHEKKWHVLCRNAAILAICVLAASRPSNAADKHALGNIPLSQEEYAKLLKTMPPSAMALPAAYDARAAGIVLEPAKDQGDCGSCWAFAIAEAFQAHLLKSTAVGRKNLSEQQQVSCNTDTADDIWGCCGGNFKALSYWGVDGGVWPIEDNYFGYNESTTTCPPTYRSVACGNINQSVPAAAPYRVGDIYTIDTSDPVQVKTSIFTTGPAYFSFDVYDDFNSYWLKTQSFPNNVYSKGAGAVYEGSHAVLVMGWDDSKGAYLCQNSWGAMEGPLGDGTFLIDYTDYNALMFQVANFDLVSAAAASLKGVGYLPGSTPPYSEAYGVSRDGRVVIGRGGSASGLQAFKWTESGGIVGLGYLSGYTASEAYSASGDGSVIVGSSEVTWPPPRQAICWRSSSGMVGLGWLPGGGGDRSWAKDVSSDGSVVIGNSYKGTGTSPEGFRWTEASGMVGLGYLAGASASYGVGVSADGSTTVGGSWFGGVNWEATRWTWNGATIGLGDLAGGDSNGTAYDVSDDGNVVVGQSSSALYPQGEAFRWTPSGGMVGLGALPGASQCTAMGVSANGSVVVGFCVIGAGWEAFYWNAGTGMISLRDLLVNTYGLDSGAWTLGSVAGVSADGLTIVGGGSYQGNTQGWVASLSQPPSPLCTDGTPFNQCAGQKPQFCTPGGLVMMCGVCGCPSGAPVCKVDGTCGPRSPRRGAGRGSTERTAPTPPGPVPLEPLPPETR
ncbi:MAG: hypothetical protein LAO51_19685 [Acidobacteriia bacterium]|nr:hypothetical protein [Terriglobia bacterium]